jgi:tRNA dimethylallyltransferase
MPRIVILGPTASGKTHLATRLALALDGEVISADSRQLYRGMNIGTGKDLEEYTIDQHAIPYHLIDILDAGEKYNVYRFQEDCSEVLSDIEKRAKQAIICGGSGLYLDAILKNYQFTGIPVDEQLRLSLNKLETEELLSMWYSRTSAYTPFADTSTRKRLIRAIEITNYLLSNPNFKMASGEFSQQFHVFGLNPSVELRRKRISERLHQRLQHGLIEEVQRLLGTGITAEQLIYYGLEYKFITLFLTGELDYPTMVARLETEIHRFAKRQMTFFRKMERDGIKIQWLKASPDSPQAISEIISYLKQTVIT